MRTLNTINSSFDSSSRPTSPNLAVSKLRTRRPATSSGNEKLVVSSKPLPKTRSRTPTPKTPRFPSAGATISSSSRTSPSLGFHDSNQQHVLSVTATIPSTRSTSSSSAPPTSKMAPGETRHRPPQLSAAAAKTVGRTPLTPKIASSAKGPTIGAPPLARRSTATLATGPSYRDDNAIAPRSGSRQGGRNSSSNSTPSGTPNLDRDGWDPRASLTSTGRQSLSRAESPADLDAKFFRASDAPTTIHTSNRTSLGSQKPTALSKASKEPKKTTSPPTSAPYTPILNVAPESSTSKFFYANDAPDLKPGPQTSGQTSANSSTSRLHTGRPSTSSSSNGQTNHGHSLPPRPHSPIKIAQPTPSILKNTGTPGLNSRPHIASPPQIASPPPLAPAATITSKRRVSIEVPPKRPRGHARTGSVPNFEQSHSPRPPMSPSRLSSEFGSPPGSPGSLQPALTMASILQAAEDIDDEDEEDAKDDVSQPELQSPTKSSHGEPVSELVANARRERKVQDLEITNASLEAINRTLERQLRKQTAEIRRYKRLSRSGRLSAVASAASSRVPSAALSDVPINLSDLSEEDDSAPSEDEEHDSFDESDMSMTDSASASEPLDPQDEKAMEKAMSRRKKDEDRLQLDLSKHRDILVDSQKINQSIKRCLNWTEVLIKEGQKALEYKIHVSDIEFGGHVLPPPNEDGEEDTMSRVDDFDNDLDSAGLEPPLPWEKSSQDRDSGIELQPDSV
ncbi:hypothetical protein FSARC_2283 [Fusarium sarcochroum]|uniref:Uncharacterized protein n=1 Tax=Fusarium sarcochroum TaxID=1208366 RepID=A0A8H4U6K5_9HYPO|nr:hypothetical protein FSARC_2283 [Fusarium sarcochroum]